jgi:hypothetical protein
MHDQFQIEPGMRVRVTHQIPVGPNAYRSVVEGQVLRVGQQKTGSWFAHSADKKLWLDRVELRKDDGEIVVLNLDNLTLVEQVGDTAQAG